MRVRPLLGTKAWFKPRALGWGWDAASWHGWLALAVYVVLVLLATTARRPGVGLATTFALTALLIGLCIVKGTSPGGPSARREYDRLTGRR